MDKHWPVAAGVATVMGLSVAIGVIHGLLITKMRLQPFVVTLCGLLLYRGIARGLTGDLSQGFKGEFKGLRSIATSQLPIFGSDTGFFHLPATTLILIIIAIVAAIFLTATCSRWATIRKRPDTAASTSIA
jgi:ribose transport system permease protein